MKIKATSAIIEWDGARMVILNPGDEDTVDDAFGQVQVDAGKAINLDVLGTLSGIEPAESTSLEPQPLAISDAERAHLPQLDHDGDGAPGGDTGDDVALYSTDGFTLTDLGGGWWTITGPGLEQPVKVRTKAKAEEVFNRMVADAAGVAADLGAGEVTGGDTGDDDDGAPAE